VNSGLSEIVYALDHMTYSPLFKFRRRVNLAYNFIYFFCVVKRQHLDYRNSKYQQTIGKGTTNLKNLTNKSDKKCGWSEQNFELPRERGEVLQKVINRSIDKGVL
jgi:hypothetical protein